MEKTPSHVLGLLCTALAAVACILAVLLAAAKTELAAERAASVSMQADLAAAAAATRRESSGQTEAYRTEQRVAQAQSQRVSCLARLAELDILKDRWAKANGKGPGATPTASDLAGTTNPPSNFAICPTGAPIMLLSVGTPATCSVHGSNGSKK